MQSAYKVAGALIVVLALAGLLARPLLTRRLASRTANGHRPSATRPVSINLLPSPLTVSEGKPYSHEFTIPGDATNAQFAGEFTVEPRPRAHIDMLLVSADGVQHWQQFLSRTTLGSAPLSNAPGSSELPYHVADTIADFFEIKLPPGTYGVIFEYSASTGEKDDHFGGPSVGPPYRYVRPRIILSYDLPCETCR